MQFQRIPPAYSILQKKQMKRKRKKKLTDAHRSNLSWKGGLIYIMPLTFMYGRRAIFVSAWCFVDSGIQYLKGVYIRRWWDWLVKSFRVWVEVIVLVRFSHWIKMTLFVSEIIVTKCSSEMIGSDFTKLLNVVIRAPCVT